mmetsp:Transcript_27805/g.41054  ORF Transcript_27805/g.41054 Transcript_27805/m.41054 type:complete len:82 (+) Transcript_27805:104-349(+)
MLIPQSLLVLHRWRLLLKSRGSYTANDAAGRCRSREETAILVVLGRFWSVWYPTDGVGAAFIPICHCSNGPESSVMVSDQF